MTLLQIKLKFNTENKLYFSIMLTVFRSTVSSADMVLVLQKPLERAGFFIPSPTRMADQQKAVGKNEYEWYDEKPRQLELAVLNLQLEFRGVQSFSP